MKNLLNEGERVVMVVMGRIPPTFLPLEMKGGGVGRSGQKQRCFLLKPRTFSVINIKLATFQTKKYNLWTILASVNCDLYFLPISPL